MQLAILASITASLAGTGSCQYPAGMALRFARVKRYRQDKSALEADTLATVAAIFEPGMQGHPS